MSKQEVLPASMVLRLLLARMVGHVSSLYDTAIAWVRELKLNADQNMLLDRTPCPLAASNDTWTGKQCVIGTANM